MKNTFLLLCASLLLSIGANAQTKKKKSTAAKIVVPEVVDASFKTTYADVESKKWTRTYTGNYVANFKNANSQEQSSEYNASGVLIKTKTSFDVAALPENVTTSVETKYAGSKISAVEKIEIPGIAPYYKVKLVTADTNREKEILVSETGSMVRS
jgi:hypothetical protein